MQTLRLDFPSTAEEAELLSDTLLLLGAHAVSFENDAGEEIFEPEPGTVPLWTHLWVSAYFNANEPIQKIITWIQQEFYANKNFHYRQILIEDKDWKDKWLEHIQPMRFGNINELWIIPQGQNPPAVIKPQAQTLYLNSILAFGSGTHETTSLCLDWLVDHIGIGSTMIDYGCGTGILALAALKSGAKQAIGIDYDPQALISSKMNADLNHISSEQFKLYSPSELTNQPLRKVDILVANILSKPLIELFPSFLQFIKPQGTILLSGILKSQTNDILNCYQNAFVFEKPRCKNDWACLVGKKLP